MREVWFIKYEVRSRNYSLVHNTSHRPTDHFLIHSHAFYEFYYCVEGDLRYIYNGTEYTVQPHTAILLAQNVFHGLHVLSDAPYERYTFHFTEEVISPDRRGFLLRCMPTEKDILLKGTDPYVIFHADSLGLLPLLNSVNHLSMMDAAQADRMVPVILEAILGQLVLNRSELLSAEEIDTVSVNRHDLDAVLSYINRNLSSRISLENLSREVHVSKSKLNNLFHEKMNTTVMEYVTRQRIAYARQLLINGFSAAQAASASGFGDYTSFYRAYVKQTGNSPSEDKSAVSHHVESPYSFPQPALEFGRGNFHSLLNDENVITLTDPVDVIDPSVGEDLSADRILDVDGR